MKKILLLILCFSFLQISAADFMHDLGIGFWSKMRNTKNAEPSSYGPFVHYMPRCNFALNKKMSISIASPLGLGARFHPTEGNFFQVQLPATVLYNVGHGAYKKEGHYNVGGYFGAGFNYILSASETIRESDYGIISLAGLRFYTHHHSLGIHVSYTHDFRISNNFIGAGLFYTFGFFE